jgi:hypothetical protein
MNAVEHVIEKYFAIWSEADAERRRALIAQTWTDESTLLGPMVRADGTEGIDGLAAGFLEHFPDHRFRKVGEINTHNDAVRFAWELAPVNDGPRIAAGVDFGRIAPDGRLVSVVTFIDQAPELAAGH